MCFCVRAFFLVSVTVHHSIVGRMERVARNGVRLTPCERSAADTHVLLWKEVVVHDQEVVGPNGKWTECLQSRKPGPCLRTLGFARPYETGHQRS